MRDLKVWFPGFYTEAHRDVNSGIGLATELSKLGIHCSLNRVGDEDVVFCGSIYTAPSVRDAFGRNPPVPVIHYSWDIYPFQLNNPDPREKARWAEYLRDLAVADEIWVPSSSCIDRVYDFVDRTTDVTMIVPASFRHWDVPDRRPKDAPPAETYVLNVMRKYPDPNRDLCVETCRRLGIPLVETECRRPWGEFRWLVGNARLLVSPYYEASTGGLTLLEGYWHGRNVLLSNSPRNGAAEYFDRRAHYFRWDDGEHFASQLAGLWAVRPPAESETAAREWLAENYSEAAFARRVADGLRRVVECHRNS